MDQMINNNWLTWILVCMLRTYDLTVEYFKYEFKNKLLGDITYLELH